MLLWITALHSQEHGYRWFPCYLDLKDPERLEMAQRLVETGYYRLLLFSTETPQSCTQVITITLSPEQRDRLRKWTQASQTLQPTERPVASRRLLKSQFDHLKSQVLEKLDLNHLELAFAV
jgi:serine/threonine-protein kinase